MYLSNGFIAMKSIGLTEPRCKFGPNQISSFLALNIQNSRPANLLNIIAGQKQIAQSTTANVNCAR